MQVWRLQLLQKKWITSTNHKLLASFQKKKNALVKEEWKLNEEECMLRCTCPQWQIKWAAIKVYGKKYFDVRKVVSLLMFFFCILCVLQNIGWPFKQLGHFQILPWIV